MFVSHIGLGADKDMLLLYEHTLYKRERGCGDRRPPGVNETGLVLVEVTERSLGLESNC